MKIENAVPYLGALVSGLDVKRITDAEWKILYQTWLDRHVLIVRGQELSKADFLAYSCRFGRLILACGDIDSCAHAPCQSKTPISH